MHNPAGPLGAYVADLLYQLFGFAAWLPVLVGLSWGLRLALGRPLAWPWLPILSLPLALLACRPSSPSCRRCRPRAGRCGPGSAVPSATCNGAGSSPGSAQRGFAAASLVAGAAAQPHGAGHALGRGDLGRRQGRRGLALGRPPAGRRRRCGHPALRPAGPRRLARASSSAACAGRPSRRASRDEPEDAVDAAPSAGARRKLVVEAADEDEAEPPAVAAGRGRAARSSARPSRRAARRRQAQAGPPPEPLPAPLDTGFELPGLDLLAPVKPMAGPGQSPQALAETSRQLETVLDDFGVRGEIIDAKTGPVVTLYELEPAPGTRAARVISLADDIARSLCALSVRVAVVPGRNVIGIELPNERRATVYLRELLEADVYAASGARLPMALGKDISGQPIVADLARMPHLLIAGTTGSGKSVAINAMILSLLYRLTPEQLRVIMIDPKVIELSVYEDIPHLLAPVVTDPPKAVVALKWVVRQMDERYRLMSHLGVRDIFAFNKRIDAGARPRARS